MLLLAAMFCLGGCGKPSGDPKAVVKTYIDSSAIMRNFDPAWDTLAAEHQRKWQKEEFKQRGQLVNQVNLYREVLMDEGKEQGEKELGGVKYPHVVQYTATLRGEGNDNKNKAETLTLYAVADQGKWKVYSPVLENPQRALAGAYTGVGMTYFLERSTVQAISYGRKAVQTDETFSRGYQLLGAALIQERRLGEALQAARKGVDVAENDKEKSEALATLGMVMANSGQREQAKSAFREAVQLDQANEYARNSITRLQ